MFYLLSSFLCNATEKVTEVHFHQPVWKGSVVSPNVTFNAFSRKLESLSLIVQ